jgi:transposase-like protein
VAETCVNGVSTRKVDRVIRALGVEGMSSSQVSRVCEVLDEEVTAFRSRVFDGAFPVLWLDSTYVKCRQNGRVATAALFVAIALDESGRRIIAGASACPSETYGAWREFLSDVRGRGVAGVALTVSDAHAAIRRPVAEACPESSWQRCRTHLMRDVLAHVPQAGKGEVSALLARACARDVTADAIAAYHAAIDAVAQYSDRAARVLEDAEDDALAYLALPKAAWRKIQANNDQERLNKEIKRRTRVVGSFPSTESLMRLVGSLLIEIDSDWDGRAYISPACLSQIGGKAVRGTGVEPMAKPPAKGKKQVVA